MSSSTDEEFSEYKEGQRVYWNDPDGDSGSGWGHIQDINGEVIHMKFDYGSEAEVYEWELTTREV